MNAICAAGLVPLHAKLTLKMDDLYPPQFSLYHGAKRLTMSARDLSRDRLECIFKVEPDSLYLEDDITRETFFPDHSGQFQTTLMRDRGSFAVSGTSKEQVLTPVAGPSTPLSCRPKGTPAFTHPSNTFQNPLRRAKSARKQIYVADIEDSGKISPYTTVHVTISEGQGVQAVGQTVQEYLNSADSYSICDAKGLAIADTSETKDLEFWKTSSRKVYAIRTADLAKLKMGRVESASKKKRVDPEENEVLDGLLDVELEIKNSASKLAENIDEKFNELTISVNHIKANVLQVVQQIDGLAEVKEKVSQVSKSLSIASSLRDALACRICTNIPNSVLVITACCGQVAGCGTCIQTYLNDNDSCLLCKANMFAGKLVFLRGLSEVLAKLTNAVI
ncbi:hypothetical protein PO909_000373 [Leuciscus waleckii]